MQKNSEFNKVSYRLCFQHFSKLEHSMCVYIYIHIHTHFRSDTMTMIFPLPIWHMIRKKAKLMSLIKTESITFNSSEKCISESMRSCYTLYIKKNVNSHICQNSIISQNKWSSLNEHEAMPRKKAWGHWFVALSPVTHEEWTTSRERPGNKPPLLA